MKSLDITKLAFTEYHDNGINVILKDSRVGVLWCEDEEEADWLSWEINDAISLGSQSLLNGAMEKIRPKIHVILERACVIEA